MYYIYTLNHPDTDIPFYVGMTNNTGERYISHLVKNKSTMLRNFVKKMLRRGEVPYMDVIYTTESKEDCLLREADFIEAYASRYTILNDERPGFAVNRKDVLTKLVGLSKEYSKWGAAVWRDDDEFFYEYVMTKREMEHSQIFDLFYGCIYYRQIPVSKWETLRKHLRRKEIKYFRIDDGDYAHIFVPRDPHHKSIVFDLLDKDEAESIANQERFLLTDGRRSISREWSSLINM